MELNYCDPDSYTLNQAKSLHHRLAAIIVDGFYRYVKGILGILYVIHVAN